MKAEILAVGTELLLGDILNTNAQFIARQLADAGVEVFHQAVVGDNPQRLQEQLQRSRSRCDLIVITGGLGPTYDDLTKEAVADVWGTPLEEDPRILAEIQSYFARLGRSMTPNNRKQALIPQGAEVLPNPNGTAPGIWLEQEEKQVVLLPGPPREMQPMFLRYVLPRLQQKTGKTIFSSTVHIFGVGESQVETLLREEMLAAQNPTIAPYAKEGEVQLRLTAMAPNKQRAEEMLAPVRERICTQFGAAAYGVDVGSLQQALVAKLAALGLHLATAESCTGGLVSQRITGVSGASAVFDCGVCTYANQMKEQLLGVQAETLAAVGAVSEEVALQMARGVRKLSGAEIGLSTTGIAGPTGGTPEKPVGLVYIGVSCDAWEQVWRMTYPNRGDDARESIRGRAASQALYAGLLAADELEKRRGQA